jgi:hypothetical protein
MFMRAPRKTPGKCAESVQIDTTPKMLENPGKPEAYAKLIDRLTGQQCSASFLKTMKRSPLPGGSGQEGPEEFCW